MMPRTMPMIALVLWTMPTTTPQIPKMPMMTKTMTKTADRGAAAAAGF